MRKIVYLNQFTAKIVCIIFKLIKWEKEYDVSTVVFYYYYYLAFSQ